MLVGRSGGAAGLNIWLWLLASALHFQMPARKLESSQSGTSMGKRIRCALRLFSRTHTPGHNVRSCVAAELGDYNQSEQSPDYLSEYSFIPEPPEDFEKEVAKLHQQHT